MRRPKSSPSQDGAGVLVSQGVDHRTDGIYRELGELRARVSKLEIIELAGREAVNAALANEERMKVNNSRY